jgi:hypothetical protein
MGFEALKSGVSGLYFGPLFILWPTYEIVNVPTTGDVQQVPLSNLEINRMESSFAANSKSCEDGLEQLVKLL